jgi:type IV secretory pathway TraG/TraD family ATPase VirD4
LLFSAALGYQVHLNSPWFDFFGTPVNHPWRLFEWWFFFDANHDAPIWLFVHKSVVG